MIYAQETWINRTENCTNGESEVYETFSDSPGELYRSYLAEYGRCVSRMYIDDADGVTRHIGWVFQKRVCYQDSDETFLLETWVSLHKAPPTVTRTEHLLYI